MASLKELQNPHLECEKHAKDHQSHANGCGGEIA